VFRRPVRVYPKPATPSSDPGGKSAFANIDLSSTSRRKMLQNSFFDAHISEVIRLVTGPEARPCQPHSRLTAPVSRSYPQAVDKPVDNHVNYLQKWLLRSMAIAL
jgi:hypothetical protein